ncbi:MAG: radical SAM family heme chaperone HemW [Erysipelotrichaceae bacterium]|mgnify:CR=1 FL=1|nr:radical SAM family heme chaperone HemW [Erysipelotrichaceae bacterium]
MIRHAYVHVPFCAAICSYCAFARSASLHQTDAWLQVIRKEIQTRLDQERKDDPSFFLETLYFGGGTPTVLSAQQLEDLLALFQPYLAQEAEITLEANPETADAAKLKALRTAGFNRISVGIQTFDDEALKKMGRRHTARQAVDFISSAREAGFENISADLMYAMPWQSMEDIRRDVQEYLKLDLEHLSIYSLILEENSVFGKTGVQPADEDLEADAFEWICTALKNAGYDHYEISSFARDTHYSRHNLSYWQDEDYLGFGYGAWGRDSQGYYHGCASLDQYLKNGYQKSYMEDQDPAFEALMMGLRTRFGVDVKAWQNRYRTDFFKKYACPLKKYQNELVYENGRLFCTERGMEILNSILVEFLEAG